MREKGFLKCWLIAIVAALSAPCPARGDQINFGKKSEELLASRGIKVGFPSDSTKSVNIFTVSETNDSLVPAGKSHLAANALAELERTYGVRIHQGILRHVVVARQDPAKQIYGFDILGALSHPSILPWFQPYSRDPDPAERTRDEERAYKALSAALETGAPRPGNQYQIGYSHALAAFSLVYVIERDLESQVLHSATQKLTSYAPELLFHESMHVLHANLLPTEVEAFLSLPGGFYERQNLARAACAAAFERTGFSNQEKSFCGHGNLAKLSRALAREFKIPQRYGKNVKRVKLLGAESCSVYEPQLLVEIQGHKLCNSREEQSEDLHSFRAKGEYFAILMQSYLFDRAEFDRVAAPAEKRFIENVFSRFLK